MEEVNKKQSQPEYCKKKYEEDVCEECPFNEYVLVDHPGGDRYRSAKKHHCEWGHWCDDF